MTDHPTDHAARLRRIVLGTEQPDARLAFYCAVTGADPSGLGTGDHGPAAHALTEALAEVVMACFGHVPAPQVRRRLAALNVQAASRLRAEARLNPGTRPPNGDVVVQSRRPAYAGFFALELVEITHPRFDGRISPPLRREVFLAGDAVTVLPYDPVRDRVLVIEQLRIGPLGRGDPMPWQIEAIAGRIDPGETPEDAARREAVEEAGLTLGRLEKVGEYYPTPGAVSEYLYSYVAICDLPDSAAGLFGAEDEGEDIRGQLWSRTELMAALARGEIGNAPLMLTAFWLDREADRLRDQTG